MDDIGYSDKRNSKLLVDIITLNFQHRRNFKIDFKLLNRIKLTQKDLIIKTATTNTAETPVENHETSSQAKAIIRKRKQIMIGYKMQEIIIQKKRIKQETLRYHTRKLESAVRKNKSFTAQIARYYTKNK